MVRSFSVSFTEDPKQLIARARHVAAENEAVFRGDEKDGTFSGSGVEGHYVVADGEVLVTITSKPFFAPWSLVEARVREFFL